jgi:hypothetical protein
LFSSLVFRGRCIDEASLSRAIDASAKAARHPIRLRLSGDIPATPGTQRVIGPDRRFLPIHAFIQLAPARD